METGRRRKIVRVIARLNVGGPAVHVWALSEGLSRFDWETVLVTGYCAEGETEFDPGTLPKNFRLLRIPTLRPSIGPWWDLVSLWRIYRVLRAERPDIVHTHTSKAGVLGRIAAFLAGVPVVIHTFHGHTFTGYFPALVSRLIRGIERLLAWRTRYLVTVSPSLREDLSGQFAIAPREKIRVISLGRNLTQFLSAPRAQGRLRAELGAGHETALIGFVGRLVPIKNLDLFLQALANLSFGRSWLAVVAGDGECRSAGEALAAQLGIAGRVRFLGWRKDLPAIYSDLTLLVNSSLNEGTPLSIIEAFASGCPVVATDVGGTRDLFTPLGDASGVRLQREGALVPSGSVLHLTRAMQELLGDADRLSRLSAAAREKGSRFSEDALVRSVDELYRSAVA